MVVYSAVLVVLTLLPNGWGGRMYFTANGTSLDNEYLNTIGLKQLLMETLPKQTSLFTEEKLTSLQGDFLANPTAKQGKDLGRKMIDISGQKCLEQFERLSRNGLLVKTFVDLLIGTGDWFSTRCKLTWKMKGTKSSRLYFQLVPKMPRTEETEYGLSLPTPKAGDWKDRGSLNRLKDLRESSGQYAIMRELASILVPTPTASDKPNDPKSMSQIERDNLASLAIKMTGKTGQLNPRFAAEMMGFPSNWTELPFQNGKQKVLKDTEMQ